MAKKEIEYEECFWCGGSGEVECGCTGDGGSSFADEDCIACCGTGFHTCPECRGSGVVPV